MVVLPDLGKPIIPSFIRVAPSVSVIDSRSQALVARKNDGSIEAHVKPRNDPCLTFAAGNRYLTQKE